MTYFISICSGKGGTGKSITTINLGYALQELNKKVILLDNNLTSPNLGVYLGLTDIPISLNDSLKRKNHATETVYVHSSGLNIIPSSISIKDLNINPENIRDVFSELRGNADFVIVDNSGGLNSDALQGIINSNEILIITNPDIASVTGALRTIKFAESLKKPIRGIVLNRVKGVKNELNIQEIEKTLGREIISIIEEDEILRNSLLEGEPIIKVHPKSKSAIEYKKLAARILGQKYKEEYEEQNHIFFNILKFFGIKK